MNPALLTPLARAAPAEALSCGTLAFGPRFFLCWLVGLVWLGPAWGNPQFVYAMLLWDLLVVAAWMWDLRRLPPSAQLIVRRDWTAPLGLLTPGQVKLELKNAARISLSATLIDDIPVTLRRGPPKLEIQAPCRGSGTGTYSILPAERGDAHAGAVFLRYRSLVGLAERRARADLSQTVRVYPNLEESKRHTLYLIRSRQMEQERRLKRQHGLGREFESLREHREGDEWRDICWTASARRGKWITKVYQLERSQTLWLVLDAGRLLRARVEGLPKLDYAVNAALSLAQVALYSGDRVGLLAYGRNLQKQSGAGRGATHLRQLVEQLAEVRSEALEADHGRAAQRLLASQKQRCLVVWLTDLAETASTPEVIESASQLMPRHLVLFVAIGQPELTRLSTRRPRDADQMYLSVAAQEMVQRRELLLRRLRHQGALALELDPRRLSTAIVNHYLEIKERRLL